MLPLDPQLLSLLGTAVSALVAALGYRSKLRHERRRTTRVVLYILLEMHHRVSRLIVLGRDLPIQGPSIVQATLRRQGFPVSGTDMLNAQRHIEPLLRQFAALQMDELRQEVLDPFRKALAELAKDDPILAFRLKGVEVLNLQAKQIAALISRAIAQDPNAPSNLADLREHELTGLANENVLRDLAMVVQKTAWKCGLWTYVTARRRLQIHQASIATQDIETQMAAFTLRLASLGQSLSHQTNGPQSNA